VSAAQAIRAQVLRALAANRAPGLHFPGHLNAIAFERLDGTHARVRVRCGAHNVERSGELNLGVLLMVADMALASSIRAGLDPKTRLATVSMSVQLCGVRAVGDIEATGTFAGFSGSGEARQGLARVVVASSAGTVCHGHGAFIALEPPPGVAMHPIPPAGEPAALTPALLTREERAILARAEAALEDGAEDFLRRFWNHVARRTRAGASATLANGPHVANRVHHAQGGLLMGLAAATACAALPANWTLTGITSCFTSPGQGARLAARARVVHHGLMTGVVRTAILGPGRRRVLETITTHSRAS
jgi:acyl-coenzyme A thioesterase PaaI-like protein